METGDEEVLKGKEGGRLAGYSVYARPAKRRRPAREVPPAEPGKGEGCGEGNRIGDDFFFFFFSSFFSSFFRIVNFRFVCLFLTHYIFP